MQFANRIKLQINQIYQYSEYHVLMMMLCRQGDRFQPNSLLYARDKANTHSNPGTTCQAHTSSCVNPTTLYSVLTKGSTILILINTPSHTFLGKSCHQNISFCPLFVSRMLFLDS